MEQNSPSYHGSKHKAILILGLAIVFVVFGIYLFISYIRPVENDGLLSEKEKQAILAQLAQDSANQTPITEAEKKAILSDLSNQSANEDPMTDEEKQTILNQLAQ